jgi:N,N'-diacetyllegionaminate synthase
MRILKYKINKKSPCFVIGEIGSNHNLNFNNVKKLINAASKAKFDAIKFQLYDAEEAFSKNVTTKDVGLDKMYGNKPWWTVAKNKILMPRKWFAPAYKYAKKKGLIPFCTIHRIEDVSFLKKIGIPLIKIASIDLTYHQLLEKLVKLKKPIIVSTGMGSFSEISKTVKLLKKGLSSNFALLHCKSSYPPNAKEINLNNICMLQKKFGIMSGYSDHSSSIIDSIVAVAKGAKIIEKHITLSRKMKGPDHPFAIEPKEMIELVSGIRRTESIMGSYERKIYSSDLSARKMIRRSVVAKVDIKKGEKITIDKIKFARPGLGISTSKFKFIDKKTAKVSIPAETLILPRMII